MERLEYESKIVEMKKTFERINGRELTEGEVLVFAVIIAYAVLEESGDVPKLDTLN